MRTVSEDDLTRLKREREAADARYNATLTAVDQAVQRLGELPHPPPGPDEHQVTPLNQQWDLLGQAPAGAGLKGRLAAFIWRNEISQYLDTSTRTLRARTADTLKQAEELVETASEKIGGTIHAGQDAIRPARVTRATGTN